VTADKPARRPGRQALPPEQKTLVGSVRLTAAQWAKFAALGGAAWLREKIDRAKMPS
jgi:hypothetical protein